MKSDFSKFFIKAVHDDCRVLFLVEVKPHIDILCLVIHKHFLPNLLTSKYRQPQLISLSPRITHLATESARVVQPIHFLVFGFKDTPCRIQDTKQKKSPSWCVMLTLKRKVASKFFDWGTFFSFVPLKMGRIGFMPKDQNREKTVIMHNFTFPPHKPTFSCPCESPCCPCVRF